MKRNPRSAAKSSATSKAKSAAVPSAPKQSRRVGAKTARPAEQPPNPRPNPVEPKASAQPKRATSGPPPTEPKAGLTKAKPKTSPKRASAKAGKAVAGVKRPRSSGKPAVPPIREPVSGRQPGRALLETESRRYTLGPAPVVAQPELLNEAGELPEAYGSRRLFLAARDPHWLYAHWDFTGEQLREVNALSADGRPVLRVHMGSFAAPPCSEVQVHPGSRNWFVHVGQGGTKYMGELGYYRKGDRLWTSLSRSEATLTPPDIAAIESEAEFATIPIDIPFETLSDLIRTVAKENVPLAEAILQLRATGYEGLPGVEEWPKTEWTPAREAALAAAVSETFTLDEVRRAWVGSLEITELLRRGLLQQRGSVELISSAGVGAIGRRIPLVPGSVSSPYGIPPVRKRFWFNVNAELILYGATEPDATVTLGGRVIRLRPDGTFSFRFALPDGEYALPAVAVSADGTDRREAALEFSRSTVYEGDVGTHPQDTGLRKPEAAAVS